jgi:hypothetical protein
MEQMCPSRLSIRPQWQRKQKHVPSLFFKTPILSQTPGSDSITYMTPGRAIHASRVNRVSFSPLAAQLASINNQITQGSLSEEVVITLLSSLFTSETWVDDLPPHWTPPPGCTTCVFCSKYDFSRGRLKALDGGVFVHVKKCALAMTHDFAESLWQERLTTQFQPCNWKVMSRHRFPIPKPCGVLEGSAEQQRAHRRPHIQYAMSRVTTAHTTRYPCQFGDCGIQHHVRHQDRAPRSCSPSTWSACWRGVWQLVLLL